MKTLETVIPFFPGFYESELDSMIDREVESVMENEEKTYEEIEDQLNYQTARLAISKAWVNAFNQETGFNLEFDSISSPKEYNFTTDRLFAKVSIDEVEKAREICNKNSKQFQEFLDNNFKSYDGFISFYSNYADDWDKETEDLDHNEVMSYLAVACLVENDESDILSSIHGTSSVYEAAQEIWN